jgi:hypothetical protein
MRLLPGSWREPISSRAGPRKAVSRPPVLAALILSALGLALGLAGSRPAVAAAPTVSPYVTGRHVYDNGGLLSANSVQTAESLAANIETSGGGRIVLYTGVQPSDIPITLQDDWQIDGLLLTGEGDYGIIHVGTKLKGKLGDQANVLSNPTPAEPTIESWMLSTLARADGLLRGAHVFDGAGILSPNGKAQAESSARNLASKIGAPVYVDIALGAKGASSDASYNGAIIQAALGKCLVIALTVSDQQIAGQIVADGSLYPAYHTSAPWLLNGISGEDATGGVQAALLAAIDAVQSGAAGSGGGIGGVSFEMIFWICFAIAMVLIGVGSPFYGSRLIRKISGVSGPIKGGTPSEAVIQSIADTGVTVTMPSVGPEAPEYKFDLLVTPIGGGTPYPVHVKSFVPRLFVPMAMPGATVGVLIDPKDPQKVSLDFGRIGGATAGDGSEAPPPGGFNMQFDASGQPAADDVASLASGVRSGAVRQIKGSAAKLLATGAHGTAVITSAQPLGKTVRDINPAAEASHLNDPMWLFTVEVSLAGQAPFPAVIGHRVPIDKVAMIYPGVKLAVAVDESDKMNEVAIDWDKSPIAS